ncbi:hypothetical protein [Cyclobacterium marinum]|uniref:Uncharacterized protein n=1 Tax=Cyclobacterium marinum (strain ATCC 25205 / DSM 745 / LMG 13164 / NCIMB 1802) TaxID=880070 RepID=G0J4T3_CYCMS|nr:hypothetical protein [Cyclobacterium marinum]AEL25313.1 hypothetical protein Cycma_1553 [Cyclobacterium marinum DSM 745]MBI0400610.1 hypothetical protein [Cyclobacterium marinum]
MKTKMKISKPISIIVMALLFLTGTAELIAQNKTAELKDFKLIIEKTDNGIKMRSEKGSAWIDLSFSLNNYRPQAVDEYGMTDLKKVSENKDENLADFLFTITKTENGIELKGIEGTAWTELKFSLADNKQQAIDQFGMTSLN